MENITSIESLKSAIVILEAEQVEAGQILKEQFHETYNSFKPINLIKKSVQGITSSPHLLDNILGTTTGLATGYLSKRLISGGSANVVRKVLGSLFQVGVTALIAKNPKAVMSIGSFLHKRLQHRKDKLSKNP